MSRTNPDHILLRREVRERKRGGYGDGPERTEPSEILIALCGEQSWVDWYGGRHILDSTEITRSTCSKCAAKLARQALKGGSAKLVQDKAMPGHWRDRGGWQIVIDDEVCGYIGFEDHYWRIYRLSLDNGVPAGFCAYYAVGANGDGERNHYSGLRDAYVFRAKEEALVKAVELRAEGRLKTKVELSEAARIKLAEYAALRKAAEAREDDLTRQRAETLAGLIEILDQHPLTNFQRSALETTIQRLKPKESDAV